MRGDPVERALEETFGEGGERVEEPVPAPRE